MNSSKLISHFSQIISLKPVPQLAGAMWFVSALIITCIIFCGLSYLIKFVAKKNYESIRLFCIIILLITANYLSLEKIRLPAYIDISFMATFFYYIGYLYQKHESRIPNDIFLALSSMLILFICMRYGYPQIVQRKYISLPFLLVCGLTGIYFNLFLCKKLTAKKTIKIIDYIGENTLIILALHLLFFKIASLILIHFQNLPFNDLASFPTIKGTSKHWWWLYTLSGLIFPLIIKYNYEIIRSRFISHLKPDR
jgi:fucose 4-O-acetylase-like acetyltransferase